MSQAGGNWQVRRWRGRWSHRGQVIERTVIVARRRWADQALERCGVEDPLSYVRLGIPGTNLVIFIPCPIEPGVIDFTPEYLARCRAYDAELATILDVPIKDVQADEDEAARRESD